MRAQERPIQFFMLGRKDKYQIDYDHWMWVDYIISHWLGTDEFGQPPVNYNELLTDVQTVNVM